MTKAQAIKHIDRYGMLLTYPLHNEKEPASLWSCFYPQSKMKWEWDSGGDDRVAQLWRLREELSRSGRVVYAKWFRGRATFFSREIFTAALVSLWFAHRAETTLLPRTSQEQLSALEMNSPLSTKELKLETDLRGKDNERDYEKGLRPLWERGLIVGFGEKEDGAFPSLMMGATSLLFEDLWTDAQGLSLQAANAKLKSKLGETNPFYLHYQKLQKKIAQTP